MIIDSHTHLGRNKHINASVDQLLKSMDSAGIDKALVFASELADCPNDYLLSEVAPHKDRLYPVAGAYPSQWEDVFHQAEKAAKLAKMYKEKEIVAVKFYTGYDHYYPEQAKVYLSTLERVGCPVIFHSGDCLSSMKEAKVKYAQPIHIDDVAVDYPKMNFIIAHMGYPWHRDTAEVCYKNSNVYADISGFVYGKLTRPQAEKLKKVLIEFIDICDSKKLLFGTDFPISDQKSYVSELDDMFGELINCHSLSLNVKDAFKL